MTKQIWIVANWKSNKSIQEASSWIDSVGPNLPKDNLLKIAVCPPDLDIEELRNRIKKNGYPIMVGAQDLSSFDVGAHTGEEAAKLFSGWVDLAILGHSERRRELGESDEMIAEKVKQAKGSGILPLLCVQDNKTPIPEDVTLVAYEPIFAIGSGHPDTPEDANQVATQIISTHPRANVLYGGSVNFANVNSFIAQPAISGVLIGGASLDSDSFVKIVQSILEANHE